MIAQLGFILFVLLFGVFLGAMIFIPVKCTKKTPAVRGYVVVRKD